MFGLADGPVGYFSSVRDAGLKQPNFGLTVAGTKGAIHIRPDHVPHAYLREAPLWRVDKDFAWKPLGAEGVDSPPVNLSDADRAAQRVVWGRRAVADLVDAIAEDREPETGMYAGRTVLEMTTAVYASALSGSRVAWPVAAGGNPLE
jgi:predicted dehydrogenase